MPLVPFDLLLTVGASAAVFLLGLMVWFRQKLTRATAVFILLTLCMSLWTSADWILRLQSSATFIQIFAWKTLFYLAVCFAPLFAVAIAAEIGRRSIRRYGVLLLALAGIAFGCIVAGLGIPVFLGVPASSFYLFFGAEVSLGCYILSIFLCAFELFPASHAACSVEEHRRASYAAVVLYPFLFAGALQLVTGPIPTGFLMPFFAFWFFLFSLLAFVRSSFLGIEFHRIESFFLLLVTFASVIVLRSRDMSEAIVASLGFIAIGLFGMVAIRGVRQEMSRRRIAEETARQLRIVEEAKNDFVDMVAHQLRSPLGGIRASAEMLAANDYGPLPEKAHVAVGLIRDSAERLLSLAETFLNASRLEVGKYESCPIPTNIREEIERVVHELQSAAELKGLSVSFTIAEDVPVRVLVDVEAIRQSLFNLLDNAIKYTDHGSVSVNCRVERGDLIVEVQDTGEGMTEDDLHKVFTKFHRGETMRAHNADGTGLGLFIVKQLVEAAHGRISVTSDGEGRGTLFRIALPFQSCGVVHVDDVPLKDVR